MLFGLEELLVQQFYLPVFINGDLLPAKQFFILSDCFTGIQDFKTGSEGLLLFVQLHVFCVQTECIVVGGSAVF